MMDPFTFALKVQQAATIGTMCAVGVAAANWARFLKGESELIGFPMHRRADEHHTQKDVVPTGASWADHYGKRSRDVDVEKMR